MLLNKKNNSSKTNKIGKRLRKKISNWASLSILIICPMDIGMIINITDVRAKEYRISKIIDVYKGNSSFFIYMQSLRFFIVVKKQFSICVGFGQQVTK